MATIAETLAQAKALHISGDLRSAEQFYRHVLQADSANAEALYLLGEACQALGKLSEAVATLEQAVRVQPDYAEAHNTLGAVLGRQAKLSEAVACFRRALELRPDLAEAHANLAAVAVRQNKLDEAAACWRRILELKPGSADAHNTLGAVLARQDKLDEAAACYRRALELEPEFAEAYSNLAAVAVRQNKLDLAAVNWRRTVELKPDFAEAHNNLGVVLWRQEKLNEAAACYARALELKPDFADAHSNLAAVLAKQGLLDEAAACCRRALELKPDFADAQHTLAGVLRDQNKLDEAAGCYRRALELKPGFADAHNNLGVVLDSQEKLDEAAPCYRRALELKPDFAAASRNLGALLTRQGRVAEAKECYLKAMQFHPQQNIWRLSAVSLCPSVFNNSLEIESYRRGLLWEIEHFRDTDLGIEAAVLATSGCRPSFNLQFHGHNDRPIREAYAQLLNHGFPGEMPTGSSGRPRVGFVVTDQHETLFLKSMGGILDRVDRDLFELVVIGSDRGIGVLRPAIRNQAIRMLSVPNKLDQFVGAIRAARLDLLYHWEVGTDGINYFLPFFRLAPVQCTSWGIQVTSGIPQLDYYLSSELVEPEDASDHYTEHLVLARTLLTYQQRVSAPLSPKKRELFGITADQHLYLCAQQLGKFHPDFDPLLAGILRADAKGVVVVTEDRQGGLVANQVRQRFAATMGDVVHRIVFLPFQPAGDYLSLIAAADVLLDPLHFGGVNTSYDGFSLNQPIVTLPSRFQRGRYTLGCYKKMGLSDCVASDPRHYVDIAVALGTDAEFRAEVVERIRRASPVLFEDMQAVGEHERIFSELVEESRAAHRPDAS